MERDVEEKTDSHILSYTRKCRKKSGLSKTIQDEVEEGGIKDVKNSKPKKLPY
jgi:hypothetical protein